MDLGLDTSRLLKVTVDLGRGYDNARAANYWDDALTRLRAMPGVTGAALATIAPFEGIHAPQRLANSAPATVGGYLRGVSPRFVDRNQTAAEYFATIGSPVLRGRTYTQEEVRSGAPVAVISLSLAREFWGAEDPIGSGLERVWGADDAPGDPYAGSVLRKPKGTRIVGVVGDTVTLLRNYDVPTIYMPLPDTELQHVRLIVTTRSDPQSLAGPIRSALLALDPNTDPQPMLAQTGLDRELSTSRILAFLTSVIGITAFGLAVIGLLGVTTFVVGQRRHEVSVRMALGASRADVVGLLLRDSLRPVVIGLIAGLVLALLIGHVIRGALIGVSGHDPIAILAALAVLLGAAVIAVLVPARRGASVDPAQVLRQS